MPSRKGVALMNHKTLVALLGAIILAVVPCTVALASGSPAVTVTIKTLKKTLVAGKVVHAGSGWITKGGTPKGKCPAASAVGALDAATHGRWTGKYYASVGGIFIT